MRQPPLTLRRWTREEYDRLVDLGLVRGDPVALIGGQLAAFVEVMAEQRQTRSP
jgi:hypothetical protein